MAARQAVSAAIDAGISAFDHADIYALGRSELEFGELLHSSPALREQIVLQSKCGIRLPGMPATADPKRYDFSFEHLVGSVEGSLRRLGTDHLDILLLHRPDPLAEPDEVARAFDHPRNRSWTRPSLRLAGCLARRDEAQPACCNEEQHSQAARQMCAGV